MAGRTRKTTEKQLAALKPFQKGQSGNPKGKPRGTISYTTALRKYLAEHPEDIQKGIKAMIRNMNRGSVGMTALILERIDGPVKKSTDVSLYSQAFSEEERAKLDILLERNIPNKS